jgi:hypothetical protein
MEELEEEDLTEKCQCCGYEYPVFEDEDDSSIICPKCFYQY